MSDPRDNTPDLARAARAIHDFLAALGVPGDDPELASTGDRVARAFAEDLLAGYRANPRTILADRTASRSRGMVIVTQLPLVTMCPHHLLPAVGRAHVAYLPDAAVVGLGALASLVDCFARRLILQEDLADRVVDALVEHLGARGAACVLDLEPTCLTGRGERRHGARAVASAFRGAFESDPSSRDELFTAIRSEASR